MITGFQNITYKLTPEEYKLLPILIKGFKLHHGKMKAITAPAICKAINKSKEAYGLRKPLSEARLRKICNYIRSKGILPLIATSDGYFVSYDKRIIQDQVISLQQRADAILAAKTGLLTFL